MFLHILFLSFMKTSVVVNVRIRLESGFLNQIHITMMSKVNVCLLMVLAAGLILISCEGPTGPEGPQGIQGEQGPAGPQGLTGEVGNANVITYEFTVFTSDWGNNLHYGSGNIFRAYTVTEEDAGGTDIVHFFNEGGAILVYANANHAGGGSLGSWHNLPYMYRSLDGIGLRIFYMFSRGQLGITRTTNGWDANSIAEDNLPDSVDIKLILIENTSLNQLIEAGVSLEDHKAVISYFGKKNFGMSDF
jgi:hypothetical protein